MTMMKPNLASQIMVKAMQCNSSNTIVRPLHRALNDMQTRVHTSILYASMQQQQGSSPTAEAEQMTWGRSASGSPLMASCMRHLSIRNMDPQVTLPVTFSVCQAGCHSLTNLPEWLGNKANQTFASRPDMYIRSADASGSQNHAVSLAVPWQHAVWHHEVTEKPS